MQLASLNSGSNGNIYYFGFGNEAILIDAGLSCREIEKRMKGLNLDLNRVKAVFITHEHSDHIFGLKGLLKKYNVPVYMTRETFKAADFNFSIKNLHFFKSHDLIQTGNFSLTAFPVSHDAANPHGFFISAGGKSAGIFNDIGYACEQVKNYFGKCHAAFLECNYDEDLLEQGNYPYYLKERIKGPKGHLSNQQALEVYRNCRSADLNYLFLSHLSSENNSPEKVLAMFKKEHDSIKFMVASRHAPGPLIDLNEKTNTHQKGQLELFSI
ncbi:MAG: MBL fold metallo-hydrolase [Cyclobacteriaceae bacterium]